MDIDTINGLPAHPLLVHGAVTLVPLAALLLVLCALWPSLGRRIGWLLPALAVVALVAVLLTTESGEWLEERVEETSLVEEHTEMGDGLTPWAVGLLVACSAVWLLNHFSSRRSEVSSHRGSDRVISAATSLPVRIVVCLLSLAVAVGSALETFRIGDSGAKAVWEKRTSGHTGDGANGLTGGGAVSLPRPSTAEPACPPHTHCSRTGHRALAPVLPPGPAGAPARPAVRRAGSRGG